jgi:rod shape-determining protein MreD
MSEWRPGWEHVSRRRGRTPVTVLLALLGCVVLQVTLPNAIPLYEALRVQFVLIAIVHFSLSHDWFASAMTGVAGGLFMDVFSGGRIGVYALCYGLVALLIGRIQERLFKDNLLTIATVIVGASLLSPVLVFNVLALYGVALDVFSQLVGSILPSAAANAVVGCTLFSIMKRIRYGRSGFGKRTYR